ncbi:carboxymuconolactone decarboxylase family protein [Azospirillum picis]|uniref:Peroxidase-related enzyme n=1 Tax=Azospirillum picis TaxID=488438 RepID=A0ABU0MPF7_9PROT|nr:carboxymuconolactone decarboxylase family protein [Azospirillum picis]MBP2301373.1 putative peroxidase-related enzyme [Azospirillum picis]MDQ0535204.1 putative peroxidase-related enzyme [Azospirillum picis]
MAHVNLVDPATSSAAVKPTLDRIKGAFGVVPNMFKAVANSPAALASMWGSFGALGQGTIGAKLGEQIAVAIADRNDCRYCLAAHTLLGQKAGATAAEMADAQRGRSADPKASAALAFAVKVVENRGAIDAADVQSLRSAGFDDEAIVEILAHVALNLFTNYVNVAFDVPVDFPGVKLSRTA